MKICLYILMMTAAFACESTLPRQDRSPVTLLAGRGHKQWKQSRTQLPRGRYERVASDAAITFFTNGIVFLSVQDEDIAGMWSYEGDILTLRFDEERPAERFKVLELQNDRFRIEADNGVVMTLDPQ